MDTLQNITDGPSIQLIPLSEVLRILCISKSTAYRLIAEGKIPRPVHIGGSARFVQHEINGYALLLLARRGEAAAA